MRPIARDRPRNRASKRPTSSPPSIDGGGGYDRGMPDQALVCAKCGAPLEAERDGSRRCPFCGARYDPVAPGARPPSIDPAATKMAGNIGCGVAGFVALFGVIWTWAAWGMGAPFPFPLFGLVFTGFAIVIGFAARRAARTGRLGRGSRRELDGTRVRDERIP